MGNLIQQPIGIMLGFFERFNLAARFLDISFSGPETNGYVD